MDIIKFVRDPTHYEAFLTGAAGTGKTTKLKEICEELLNTDINFQVVAYTHKAKQVLMSKLPANTPISTLHSFLKKRPGINENATHIKAIMTSNQHGVPEPLDLLIIDEYSFVGEKDDISLCELQDPLMMDKPLHILYVGDANQLPPIGAPSNLVPHKPYWTKLTKVHRTDNDLLITLSKLVGYIEESEPIKYLAETENFRRKQDIINLYINNREKNKILLAFTNKKVQELNFSIQGSEYPYIGNYLFISSLRIVAKFITKLKTPNSIYTTVGIIDMSTKYNPLGYLHTLSYVDFFDIEVVESYNEDLVVGRRLDIATIFGTYTNKVIRDKLGKALVAANVKNKAKADTVDAKKIFREYKTVNDYVCISDFNHCMTVHKSQGSEYDYVYLDSEDFKACIDIQTRLKLLYVGISRAKKQVFLNN